MGTLTVKTSGSVAVKAGTPTLTVPLDPATMLPTAVPPRTTAGVFAGGAGGMANVPLSDRVAGGVEVPPVTVRLIGEVLDIVISFPPEIDDSQLAKDGPSWMTAPSLESGGTSRVTALPNADPGTSVLSRTTLSVAPGATLADPGVADVPLAASAPSMTKGLVVVTDGVTISSWSRGMLQLKVAVVGVSATAGPHVSARGTATASSGIADRAFGHG